MYERLKAKEAELAYNAAKGRILKKLAGIKIVKNTVLHESAKGRPQKAPAAMSPATSSTSWLSGMMTTEPAEQSTGPRLRQSSI
jgi:hypothetical protein